MFGALMAVGPSLPNDFSSVRRLDLVKQPPVKATYAPSNTPQGYIKSYTGAVVSISIEALDQLARR